LITKLDIAENNRQRYHLDQSEISSRRQFVAQMRQKIDEIKAAIQSPDVQLKRKKLERDQLLRQPASARDDDRMARVNKAVERDNDEMIRSEGERQQMILVQQDEDLAELEASITRIGEIGVAIRDEVDVHNRYAVVQCNTIQYKNSHHCIVLFCVVLYGCVLMLLIDYWGNWKRMWIAPKAD